MDLPATADVVVVGGGINGAAIVYHLARMGVSRIVVIEARTIAHGASSRGAGIIRTYYGNDDEAKLALLSLETFRNWRDEIGGSCGYLPTGLLWMVGPDGVAELEANVAAQRRLGAMSEVVSPGEIARLQPHLAIDGIGAAVFEALGGFGNPKAATLALHAAAGRLSARLFEGLDVMAFTQRSGRVTGVETARGSIAAPVVILAAGAWSVPLAASAGVAIPLVPTRMTTGTIRHAAFARSPMVFIDTVSDTFWRPAEEPGVAHISIRDACHNSVLDLAEDWPGEMVSQVASLEGIARLSVRIPSLVATPMRAWVGPDGVTPDLRAIYGRTPVEGLFLCVGGNFKGFKVAPAVGLCLAELITGGLSISVDLSGFDLARFAGAAAPLVPPAYNLSNVA
jgi:sarcosine oxidase subunit beta